jgi:hypothetical protein
VLDPHETYAGRGFRRPRVPGRTGFLRRPAPPSSTSPLPPPAARPT